MTLLADWNEGDVHVFEDLRGGGYTCMCCTLRGGSPSSAQLTGSKSDENVGFQVETAAEMVQHLTEHVKANQRVPESAFRQLLRHVEDGK